MKITDLPTYDELMFPTIEALKEEGGASRNQEVVLAVAIRLDLTDEHLEVRYETSGRPIFADRISWALSYLKMGGAADNSKRGVWALTESGWNIETEEQIKSLLKDIMSEKSRPSSPRSNEQSLENLDLGLDEELSPDGEHWKGRLLQQLLDMTPSAFERLTQRLLREAGFRDVEVLGQPGDGGIDGVGMYRLSLVSFPIFFQCKRHKGSVSSGTVRDFRGAMVGRGEKGLLVTTGTFTRGAREEASRDGAPPVDLIDGDDLCDLLKEYELGIQTRMVEEVDLNPDFFSQFESK